MLRKICLLLAGYFLFAGTSIQAQIINASATSDRPAEIVLSFVDLLRTPDSHYEVLMLPESVPDEPCFPHGPNSLVVWQEPPNPSVYPIRLTFQLGSPSPQPGVHYKFLVRNTDISNFADCSAWVPGRFGPPTAAVPNTTDSSDGIAVSIPASSQGPLPEFRWEILDRGNWTALFDTPGLYSGVNTNTLSLLRPGLLDGYQFRARIWNGAGETTSNPSSLRVFPGVPVVPAEVSSYGEPVTLHAATSGRIPSVTYRWEILDQGAWTALFDTPGLYQGVSTSDLTLLNPIPIGGFRFRVRVSTLSGSAISNETLLRLNPPVAGSLPANLSAFDGQTVALTASGVGPHLEYRWQILDRGQWTDLFETPGLYQGVTSAELRIFQIAALNGYQFRFRISNEIGQAFSSATTLAVYNHVNFPSDVQVTEGRDARFSVEDLSAAASQIEWRISRPGIPGFELAGAGPVLTIPSARLQDNGLTVQASLTNAWGSVLSRVASLIVLSDSSSSTSSSSSSSGQSSSSSSSTSSSASSISSSSAGSSSSVSSSAGASAAPACANGIDDDGDGLIDYPQDPGCASADDDTETNPNGNQCDNGLDDNSDGLVDIHDPTCADPFGAEEGDLYSNLGCAKTDLAPQFSQLKGTVARYSPALRAARAAVLKGLPQSSSEFRRGKLLARKISKQLTRDLSDFDQNLRGLPSTFYQCAVSASCARISEEGKQLAARHSKLRTNLNRRVVALFRLRYGSGASTTAGFKKFSRTSSRLKRGVQKLISEIPSERSVCQS